MILIIILCIVGHVQEEGQGQEQDREQAGLLRLLNPQVSNQLNHSKLSHSTKETKDSIRFTIETIFWLAALCMKETSKQVLRGAIFAHQYN